MALCGWQCISRVFCVGWVGMNYDVTFLVKFKIFDYLCNIKTTKHMDAIIGNNIKSLRSKLGLNQEDIAEYLGLSRQQIIRYEKGESAVPTDNLTKLAELFSVDEYDFYEENIAKVNANLAFAFRADELRGDDLKTIAAFKKIAMNYLKMKEAVDNE